MGIDMSQYVPGLNPSLIKESDKKNTENIRYALNTYIDILFFIMFLIYFHKVLIINLYSIANF